MPQTIDLGAFAFGAVLLLLALTAGEFSIFGAQIGRTVGGWPRALAGISGVVFLGFAVWHALQSGPVAPSATERLPPATAGPATVQPAAPTLVAPHAPEIQVGSSTKTWGEETKLVSLKPGDRYELDGLKLYSNATTYPQSSCAGPGYILYTWQVREPYPEGGDLEIRSVIPMAGGPTEQKALGAMGRAQLGPCGIDYLINRGLQSMKVELRYATAVDDNTG